MSKKVSKKLRKKALSKRELSNAAGGNQGGAVVYGNVNDVKFGVAANVKQGHFSVAVQGPGGKNVLVQGKQTKNPDGTKSLGDFTASTISKKT